MQRCPEHNRDCRFKERTQAASPSDTATSGTGMRRDRFAGLPLKGQSDHRPHAVTQCAAGHSQRAEHIHQVGNDRITALRVEIRNRARPAG